MRRGMPIGGQALPNGVMIRSPYQTSIALYRRSGQIIVGSWPNKQRKRRNRAVVRGIDQLFLSLASSFLTMQRAVKLSKSAGKLSISPRSILCAVSAFLLLALYALASDGLYRMLNTLFPEYGQHYLFTLIDGIADVAVFFFTLYIITRLPAVRRMLRYHGAEHKAIACYENGLDMTIENVRGQSRFHKRCGTSMMVAVVLAGIVVPVFIPPTLAEIWQELIFAVCLLIAAGLAYEAMRSGKKTLLTRLGMAAQRVTTQEPDDVMIECAISAVHKAVGES